MKIAFLGWGSLIWDPRDLQTKGDWHHDGPLLPIEFARISKDGRLTLVILEKAQSIPVLWIESTCSTLENAISNLQEREGCTQRESIWYLSTSDKSCFNYADAALGKQIEKWAIKKQLDAVVWTGLPSNFTEKTGKALNIKNIIAYLKGLDEQAFKKAFEYVENTPTQIRTEFRSEIENELN